MIMTKDRKRIATFIKNKEEEYNIDLVSNSNAVWIPLITPAIFIPIECIIYSLSENDFKYKSIFPISIVLVIIINAWVFISGIKVKKLYGSTKAFFSMRMYSSAIVTLFPLYILLFEHYSEEYNSVNDRRYLAFFIAFMLLMTISFFLSVYITRNMIKNDYFANGSVGMIGINIEILYVPLLIAGKIIGKNDNSYVGFIFICAIMSYMVFKATYYYLKIKSAVKYDMEDLLPQLEKIAER